MLRIGTMKQLLTTSKIHQSPLLVNFKNTGCIREIHSGFRNPEGLRINQDFLRIKTLNVGFERITDSRSQNKTKYVKKISLNFPTLITKKIIILVRNFFLVFAVCESPEVTPHLIFSHFK